MRAADALDRRNLIRELRKQSKPPAKLRPCEFDPSKPGAEFPAKLAADFVAARCDDRQCWPKNWRRERDSNPRRAFDPYTLSRGAPSTTRPSLRGAQS